MITAVSPVHNVKWTNQHKEPKNFVRLREALFGAALDSTNSYPHAQIPFTFGVTDTTITVAPITVDQNVDGISIDIDSEATTADVINIAPTTLTTGNVFDVADADALTTGSILNGVSNSASTGTRSLVRAANNNALATGAIPIVAVNASTDACIQALSNAAGAQGAIIELNQKSASSADNDITGSIIFKADDEEGTPGNNQLARIDAVQIDATGASWAGQMNLYTSAGGAVNESVRILGDGSISIDLSSGSGTALVFDDHKDAVVLGTMTTDPSAFMQWLTDQNIASPKATDSGEYMVQLQPFLRLMTGGIYQNHALIGYMAEQIIGKMDEVCERLFGTDSGLALPEGAVNPA